MAFKTQITKVFSIITVMSLLSGCARDLSTNMYVSDSTMNLTLEGVVVSTRIVKIKNTDQLGNNSVGALAGGATGAAIGSGAGSGSGTAVAMVGGAIAGGIAGAVIQDKLGQSTGYEYIVKVDASKIKDTYFEGNTAMRHVISTARVNGLITVVQGKDTILSPGQKVYVIYSENRTRIIPAN